MRAKLPLRRMRPVGAALLLMVAAAPGTQASIPITGLGSNSFAIDPNSVLGISYTQSAESLSLQGQFSFGDTLSGAFGSLEAPISLDLSGYPSFGLSISVTAPSFLNSSFTIQFYSSGGLLPGIYDGELTAVGTNETVVWLSLYQPDPLSNPPPVPLSNLTNVIGFQFTWDDPGTNSTAAAVMTMKSLVGAELQGFFAARSPGGFRFLTTAATNGLSPSPDFDANTNGAILPAGASAWQALSDCNAKTDITALDHRKTLGKLAKLPVTSWHYRHNPALRHLGPMAQDFRAAFGLGFDDRHVSTLDTDGVALSALKGLIEELQERRERSAKQSKRLVELEAELRELNERVESSWPPAP